MDRQVFDKCLSNEILRCYVSEVSSINVNITILLLKNIYNKKSDKSQVKSTFSTNNWNMAVTNNCSVDTSSYCFLVQSERQSILGQIFS